MEPTSSPAALLLFAAACFLGIAASTARIHSGDFDSYYDKHCGGVVPPQPIIASESASSYAMLLQFYGGYFSADGGRRSGAASGHDLKRAVSFAPMGMRRTESEDVISLHGSLVFADPYVSAIFGKPKNRRLRQFHVRGPRIPVRRDMVKFRLNGYWSQSSGKLCMIGSGMLFFNHSFNAVFKLNYPLQSTINSSFVSGVLESLDAGVGAGGADHFGTVSVLALRSGSVDYDYSLIEREGGSGSFGEFDDGGGDNLSSEKLGQGLCSALKWNSAFDLEYRSVCDGGKCNPLSTDVGFLPKAMSFTMIRCLEEGKMQLLLNFRNDINFSYGYRTFDPSTTLISEGEWDSKANRWCAVACRILNFSTSLTDAFAGNCSIKLCWRFPATFSVINRYPVVGSMWSNETVKDSGYFDKIKFWGHNDVSPDVKYEYGVMGSVGKPCESKAGKHKRKRYPNSYSSDMRFDMSIKFKKGEIVFGYSTPLFVGDKRFSPFHIYDDRYIKANRTENTVQLNSSHSPLQNISYTINFIPPATYEQGGGYFPSKAVDIFAEGTYNEETGRLCMMGCRYVTQSGVEVYKNGSMDCKIQINIQLHPLSGKANEKIKGTIKSTRVKSDPLYFDLLDLASSSMYVEQADESIWRMDLEIVMVLVSNTLACVFVGLQLFHVKKQPEVLPFISITMLIVLTLGHMIPLLLNFEALMTNHNRQSIFLGSGGWLEVNEVIVRVVTMVAFLLELYLLRMTWSARHGDDKPEGLWVSEKKVIFVSLPMYIGGGLIAWFIHQWRNSHRSPFLRRGRIGYQQVLFWGDLKSYAGLVLDGFLLPQLLFNLFFDSSVEALSRSYYVGTTIVRLVPHVYDLYRAYNSGWNLDPSYIYANHRMDFYSPAWDIIIPFGGLLFAVFIYLQQRFGGRCILPKRFRGTPVYEKVPTVGTIEL